jgi:hypothetical protein
MRYMTIGAILLAIVFASPRVFGQTSSPPQTAERHDDLQALRSEYELQGARLEEIAMCHHAIKAAKHEAVAFGQNPYYRYILNAPQKGRNKNIYPIPERCKNIATDFVLSYTTLESETKATQEKALHDVTDMTVEDVSSDAQFMTVVLDKVQIEGDDAVYWENRDKHVPKP